MKRVASIRDVHGTPGAPLHVTLWPFTVPLHRDPPAEGLDRKPASPPPRRTCNRSTYSKSELIVDTSDTPRAVWTGREGDGRSMKGSRRDAVDVVQRVLRTPSETLVSHDLWTCVAGREWPDVPSHSTHGRDNGTSPTVSSSLPRTLGNSGFNVSRKKAGCSRHRFNEEDLGEFPQTLPICQSFASCSYRPIVIMQSRGKTYTREMTKG